MNDKADDESVRRKRRRAPGRLWTTRRPPDVLTDPVLRQWEGLIAAAIKKLPAAELVALTLASEGLRPHEIAARLQLSTKTVNQRLYRARKRVRELVREMERGDASPALIGLIAHRLRGVGQRLLRLGTHGAEAQTTAVSALLPLVACSLLTPGSLAAAAPMTRLPPPSALLVARVSALARPSAPTPGGSLALGAAPQSMAPALPASRPRDSAAGSLLPLRADSPDTSQVISVAPSPHYDQDHTVVALGLGQTCACPELFRSTDGGASWNSTTIAASGSQVVLPPNYPTDSRIFIGQEPGSLTPDWVSAGWGQPFTPLLFPPGAVGHLAVVGERVLSISTTAAWSLDPGSTATPVLAYQGAATLAATPSAAYILAPPHAVGSGLIAAANEPALFACTPACDFVGTVPLPTVGPLAVVGTMVVAAAGPAIVASHDGGHSFATIDSPSGMTSVDGLAATSTAMWVVSQQRVVVYRASGNRWESLSLARATSALVPLSLTRLIARLANGGISCSANDGASWAPRCPPDPAP